MSKKCHCLWAALLAVILMCSPGCSKKDTGIDQGEANIPTQAPLAETVTAAPTQAPTDTPVPTAEPTPSPTPEPEGQPAHGLTEGSGLIGALLARGTEVEVTAEQDETYYAIAMGEQTFLVEKRFVRMIDQPAPADKTMYARRGAQLNASPYMDGEQLAELKQNTQLQILEDLGVTLLVRTGDQIGYVRAEMLSGRQIRSGGGSSSDSGGGDSGGDDGGDIQLSSRGSGSILRLGGFRREAAAPFAPGKGLILADEVEAYTGFMGPEDVLKLVEYQEGERYATVLFDHALYQMDIRLVRVDGDPAYEPWTGYARNRTVVYDTLWRLGEGRELRVNTQLQVIAETGDAYLCILEDGSRVFTAKENISDKQIQTGGGGSSSSSGGDDWTEPAL